MHTPGGGDPRKLLHSGDNSTGGRSTEDMMNLMSSQKMKNTKILEPIKNGSRQGKKGGLHHMTTSH